MSFSYFLKIPLGTRLLKRYIIMQRFYILLKITMSLLLVSCSAMLRYIYTHTTYIHTHTDTHRHTDTHTYTHTHKHIYNIYIYVYIYIYIYIYVCICINTFIQKTGFYNTILEEWFLVLCYIIPFCRVPSMLFF